MKRRKLDREKLHRARLLQKAGLKKATVEAAPEDLEGTTDPEATVQPWELGKISAKDAARHFPGIPLEELYQADGRWQLYCCHDCGHQWAMHLVHRGVTPFTMACEKCGKLGHSEGQQDERPADYHQSKAEWRQLDVAEMDFIKSKDAAYYDHLQQGGLAAVHAGKRVDATTAKPRPSTAVTTYEIDGQAYPMPQRNDYCPCDSGKKFKRCCDGLPRKEQLEKWTAAAEARPKKVIPEN